VPATVGVLEGTPVVGMSNSELEAFARRGPDVAKCSTRELPLVMATQSDGATTVAATARLAASVGVEVFVTGGCGGVHRGGESSWDVSADLVELSRVPVLVVREGKERKRGANIWQLKSETRNSIENMTGIMTKKSICERNDCIYLLFAFYI